MDSKKIETHVLVVAYQRPEKLQARYREIREWSKFRRLTIVIDGLREKSGEIEFINRKKVIEVAEAIALGDNQVDVFVWNENIGLNGHTARVFAKMRHLESLIVVEDDVGVNEQALNFLHSNVQLEGSLASTAHVVRNHSGLGASNSRSSVFPSQWGLAITRPVMETYLEVIHTKQFHRKTIRTLFHSTFGDYMSKLQIERITQWWFNHFFFCERHGNWADALIQYSVYVNGGVYRVPAQSLIVDDNTLNDPRSMNQRQQLHAVVNCDFATRVMGTDFYSCINCEISNSRLNEATIRNLVGATRHRKSLQFSE